MGAAATFIIGDAFLNKGKATAGIQQTAGLGPKSSAPQVGAPPIPDDPANQTAASKAAARRRALYTNVGRSSTILTGPSGLGSAPLSDSNAPPKSLLGL